MFKSSNPALNANNYSKSYGQMQSASTSMTMDGTVNKTAILLALVILAAVYPWYQISTLGNMKLGMPLMIGGFIGGFILALITIFKPNFSPVTAPIYAIFEGVALGAVSALYNAQFQGIALQALMLTIGVLSLMLFLYRTKIIQATAGFRMGVVCATGAIALVYLVSLALSFFGIQLSFMHDSSPLSIGISLVIVTVASLNLILDFDLIENNVNSGAPKYMEWYGAFGLLVTLVWLYLEMLRLLAKLKGRD